MPAVRALRGATTLEEDTPEQVHQRVAALLEVMLERNGVANDDLISILFTATDDVRCMFPAKVARAVGLGGVPLLCARELAVDPEHGGTRLCIRILMHINTERARDDLHHVYQEEARSLRDDLPS